MHEGVMGSKYSAQQFINAIPGTGGIISAIADRVGCDWHTARRYIDRYSTVRQVFKNERHKVTDKARHNIIKAIQEGDIKLSKWWLQVLDDEFAPRQKVEVYDWRTEAKDKGIDTADLFEQFIQNAYVTLQESDRSTGDGSTE